MSLYEDYKRFKAGKKVTYLSRRTKRLFKIELSDEQLMEISEWDHKNDINVAIGFFLIFILGVIFGAN